MGNNFESLASVKLPKGKYILTLSFFAKPTGTILYLYFGQTQTVLPNYFYAPNNSTFIPLIFRKLHNVTNDGEQVVFNTYCNQSYPVSVRDVILTAQEVK